MRADEAVERIAFLEAELELNQADLEKAQQQVVFHKRRRVELEMSLRALRRQVYGHA